MLLRSLQEFINSVFKFAQLHLSYHHYSYIRKQAKMINVAFTMKTKETIPHLGILELQAAGWSHLLMKAM
ncbi:transposase [Candidatus Enterovibrio altilux]|uniref:Mobile element protein n=1 Tax=Candidatus Enterovibrio altilux TaxID=1927128 RepID=A0A291BAZ4_9GAMM|nr:transposase [Candidatus Enterovibrio luxaltus]ATF10176.1 Mobile element protein [Candidatus Enterovibrio luxaltus]